MKEENASTAYISAFDPYVFRITQRHVRKSECLLLPFSRICVKRERKRSTPFFANVICGVNGLESSENRCVGTRYTHLDEEKTNAVPLSPHTIKYENRMSTPRSVVTKMTDVFYYIWHHLCNLLSLCFGCPT